jgi:hypothetical protein
MEYRMSWKIGHWEGSHYISKGTRGYWSKYGGGRQVEDLQEHNWVCQSCKEEQFNVLPSYRILFDGENNETARVCVLCKHKSVVTKTIIFLDLIDIIRIPDYLKHYRWAGSLANLLTLPLNL